MIEKTIFFKKNNTNEPKNFNDLYRAISKATAMLTLVTVLFMAWQVFFNS